MGSISKVRMLQSESVSLKYLLGLTIVDLYVPLGPENANDANTNGFGVSLKGLSDSLPTPTSLIQLINPVQRSLYEVYTKPTRETRIKQIKHHSYGVTSLYRYVFVLTRQSRLTFESLSRTCTLTPEFPLHRRFRVYVS